MGDEKTTSKILKGRILENRVLENRFLENKVLGRVLGEKTEQKPNNTLKNLAYLTITSTILFSGCAINQFSFSYRSPDCTNTPSSSERYMNALNGWRNLKPLPKNHPKVKGYESFSIYTDSRGHTHISYYGRNEKGKTVFIYDERR